MLQNKNEDIGASFQWPEHLPYIQFVINTTLQHSIKMSPYEAVFGRKPNLTYVFSLLNHQLLLYI